MYDMTRVHAYAHAVTMPVYIALRRQVSGACMAPMHCAYILRHGQILLKHDDSTCNVESLQR